MNFCGYCLHGAEATMLSYSVSECFCLFRNIVVTYMHSFDTVASTSTDIRKVWRSTNVFKRSNLGAV